MLFRDDMLDMVYEIAVLLTEQAVFATVVRSPADQGPCLGIGQVRRFDSKLRRALSLRIVTKFDARGSMRHIRSARHR